MNGLHQRKNWVMWKLEHKEGAKKPTKVPYSPITGYGASSTDPSHWSDYNTALNVARVRDMTGIGYMISENDPYFFIDIDNCLQPDNTWSPFALNICNRFPGAYIEVSQSGTGLHIICTTSEIPKTFNSLNNQTIGLEMYWRWRFVAMTMNSNGDPDIDCTAGVLSMISDFARDDVDKNPDNWTTTANSEWDGPLDDEELIRRALDSKSAGKTFNNKASFKDLWTRNVAVLAKTYPTDQDKEFNYSGADIALCSHLAFWTGCNCERIEQLFNRSALVRGKWSDRQKYRQDTILGAISLCDAVYKQPPSLTPELISVVQPAPTLVVPNTEPAYNRVTPGGYYAQNHTVNAATFVQNYYPNNTLVFVQQQPYRFNGRVWERFTEDELKHQLAMAMLSSEPKADVINGTFKVLSYLFTRANIVLGTWPSRDTSHLIVCQNGILDVHTGILEPHNAAFFTTSILPYNYDPNATAPQWLSFLSGTLENDLDRILLLQEWLGYMLVTSYEYQKAMLLLGALRSGKGTIGRILKELVGEQTYAGISLGGLATDAILENISDKSVLFVGDAHSISGNDRNKVMEAFKSITGNDNISFNRKYKGAWNGTLPGRITMAANNIPAFADDSGAMANRLLILSFNKSFLGSEDPTLTPRLLTELPGICNWAIQGLARLRANGRFTEPEASRIEREEIISQQAPLISFINERCEMGEGFKETTDSVYNAYKMWRVSEGGSAMTRTTFARALRSTMRGKIDKRPIRIDGVSGTPQGWIGLKLKDGFMTAPNNVIPFTGTGK